MAEEFVGIEKTLEVRNGLGLHARVATSIVRALQNYSCQVTLVKDDVEVDARSVLGLLLLAATPGSTLLARATGPDSMDAIGALDRLFRDENAETIR
ncbi:MAG: HPr family phosphocarrier protein [Pseudomonadota bacterium]|jgi:phosphocarrier protein HPr